MCQISTTMVNSIILPYKVWNISPKTRGAAHSEIRAAIDADQASPIPIYTFPREYKV